MIMRRMRNLGMLIVRLLMLMVILHMHHQYHIMWKGKYKWFFILLGILPAFLNTLYTHCQYNWSFASKEGFWNKESRTYCLEFMWKLRWCAPCWSPVYVSYRAMCTWSQSMFMRNLVEIQCVRAVQWLFHPINKLPPCNWSVYVRYSKQVKCSCQIYKLHPKNLCQIFWAGEMFRSDILVATAMFMSDILSSHTDCGRR